jgi:hypothetical protein
MMLVLIGKGGQGPIPRSTVSVIETSLKLSSGRKMIAHA